MAALQVIDIGTTSNCQGLLPPPPLPYSAIPAPGEEVAEANPQAAPAPLAPATPPTPLTPPAPPTLPVSEPGPAGPAMQPDISSGAKFLPAYKKKVLELHEDFNGGRMMEGGSKTLNQLRKELVDKIFILIKNKEAPFTNITTTLNLNRAQANIRAITQYFLNHVNVMMKRHSRNKGKGIIAVLSTEDLTELIKKTLSILAPKGVHQLFKEENGDLITTHMKREQTRFKSATKAMWDELMADAQHGYTQ
ncbi:hypothetical protein GYMLUDRAFT_244189 [Collybiopsis luxurians FD-317 M1]|uniref:Uncharacterized protein n=1 Tax=Collybiopsis luxurians FD-317 M1 TaxID=944289 RepID=A0A0D0BY05_9AGAR|nr:hypothetical protein GYMLUDRAFT_244189 [Collybiopsis luxurians FD-317 M1]